MSQSRSTKVPVVTVVVKTNQGAMWIIPQIKALLAQGYRVAAVIPAGDGRLRTALDELAVKDGGFQVAPIDYDFAIAPRIATIKGILKLRKILKRLDTDVVFYHLYASALASRTATVFTRIRTVHMVAGPLYLENRLISFFERLLQFRDDRIIAGSKYTYEKYRGLGTAAKKLTVVPYGVDLRHFDPTFGTEVFTQSGDSDTEKLFTVVMVAYFYAPKQMVFANVGIKGHEIALSAWRDFMVDKDDAQLVLVGSGFGERGDAYRDRLKRTSDGMGLKQSVVWVDTVDDVRGLYNSADLSISPSLSDNHGAVLEASAMAVPSVVSSAGALSEAVTDLSGWVFSSGDVAGLRNCLELAYEQWLAQSLIDRGEAARKYMEEAFDIEDSARAISRTVQSLTGRVLGNTK